MTELSHHSLPPAPSPSHKNIHYFFHLLMSKLPKGQLLRIQLWVFITIILLFVLFFLGRLRRFVHSQWIIIPTKSVYTLIPIAITYIMGLMHNASTFHVLYPVWACALIYAYGGVITITVCDITDNDRTLVYLWQTFPLIFWTIWLAFNVPFYTTNLKITWGGMFGVFLVVAIWNTKETLEAFNITSKSKGLPGLVGPLVEYMRERREEPMGLEPVERYKYVVWGNPAQGGDNEMPITTTNDIWESVENSFPATFVGADLLGDICLSYAYFRLILRRFAQCPLNERSQPRTRRFVREELLIGFEAEPEKVSERVFRVIEVELAFLFEFFYTKSYVCSYNKYTHMLRPLVHAVLLLLFGTAGISLLIKLNDKGKSFNIQFHGHSVDVGITRVVTFIFSALEIWKFVMACSSNRKMVWLLCTYRGDRKVTIVEKAIVYIWKFKDFLRRKHNLLSKPWRRKLPQYSFLDNYDQVPKRAHKIFSPLAKLVKLPRVGQCGKFSIALSTQVKQAIAGSLFRHVEAEEAAPLSLWTATMERHNLQLDCMSIVCPLESTDAYVILVWHIATCFYESKYAPPSTQNQHHFLAATQLSKYCAYLVSFAPELLPDYPYTTVGVFNKVSSQARRETGRNWNTDQRYINAIRMNNPSLDDNIIVKGALLAQELKNKLNDTPDGGWKFLAEFWADMLLCLAVSENVAVHGEYLARGGEFITHVWALLTHAGTVA